jgi:hypothetical protein
MPGGNAGKWSTMRYQVGYPTVHRKVAGRELVRVEDSTTTGDKEALL